MRQDRRLAIVIALANAAVALWAQNTTYANRKASRTSRSTSGSSVTTRIFMPTSTVSIQCTHRMSNFASPRETRYDTAMYAVRVVPLAALPPAVPQVLDYFWTAPLSRGALVRATVGRRPVVAVVLESLELSKGKLSVKKANFSMKKLEGILSEAPQATEEQLALAHWLASQYAAGPAVCMKTVLPAFVGKRNRLLTLPIGTNPRKRTGATQFVITQPDTALARMEKACHETAGQTLIVVPEIGLAKFLAQRLKAYRPALVHGDVGAQAAWSTYRGVLDGTTRVVVGTRSALFLPFHDLRRVLVEDPQHEAYKSDMSPRYATPDVARHLASLHGASLMMLTPSLAVTHQYIADKNSIPVIHEKPHWPAVTAASMTQEKAGGNRSLFSQAAKEAILDARDRREPVLLYSARRAYATAVSCAVCHEPALCTTCDIPLRLHRTTEDFLVCYRCAAYVAVPKRCPACSTGTYRPAGLAGSQRIAEGLNIMLDRHGLPKIRAPILDSDLVRTASQESETLARLDAMPWPVLVGSAMVLSHRYARRFGLVVVTQVDALATNPDFRTSERLIWQLEKLADFRPDRMILQSWHHGGIPERAAQRAWTEFLAEELDLRKSMGWPPFKRLVKIACSGRDASTARRLAKLAADRLIRSVAHLKLSGRVAVFGPTPALASTGSGRFTEHVVLKTTLTGPALAHLLAHLPAGTVADVDPRSIT